MAKTKSRKAKAWRFYRSNLATIVWNPEEGRPLADFSAGHFTTDDEAVADKLREMGYVEIDLDATEPPDVIVNKPVTVIEGDVPIVGANAPPIVVEKKMKDITTETGGPTKPTAKKPTVKKIATKKTTKATAKKPAAKKKPAASSTLRRRKKK